MKSPFCQGGWLSTACLLIVLPAGLNAGQFNANFDDGQTPAGSSVHGNTLADTIDGFSGGAMKLVTNVNGMLGAWIIEDLDGGEPVNSLNATFKVRAGGGTSPPADGWSFSFANDLADGGISEEGLGNGLIVAFDIYDNGAGEAPAITIRWNNAQLAEVKPGLDALITGEAGTPIWADAQIKLDPDGALTVVFDGVTYFDKLYTPYEPIVGGRFALGARTGGLNMNVFIDDFNLTTTTGGLQAAIVHQPQSSTFIAGSPARFFALLANEAVATGFKWQRKEPGGATFLDIIGADSRDFVSASPVIAADNGAQYRLAITDGMGTTFSDEVTLTVGSLPAPAADYTQSFDGGVLPPAEGALHGNALIDPSGFVQLTDAVNGIAGTLILNDIDAGASISSIFAAFDLRLGTGTLPPADGFSFNWAADLPDGIVGDAEEGAGSGLRLCFDVYDNTDGNPLNGVGEAPTIDLKWGTTTLATARVSPYEVFTDLDFAPVAISLDPAGLVTVAFNGRIYFQDVEVPSWSALANGRFGFYARTGGLNQQYEIDNVRLTTTAYAGPIQITQEPSDLLTITGAHAQFTVNANYAFPPATVQWQRKGASDADFADILNANSPVYISDPLVVGDDGARFRARVAVGASNLTSREALLTVLNFTPPGAPDILLTFDSGDLTNTGSAAAAVIDTYGNAMVLTEGGVNDSGYLSLTDAVGTQSGALVVENFSGGNAQGSLIATFHVNLTATGTIVPAVPADGFSFNWGEDAPADTIAGAEDGAGTGISITFDTYDNTDANPDNGVGEAPAIGIKYLNAFIVPEVPVTRAFFQQPDWVPVGIRIENDGTMDVVFNNIVVFNNVQIPNWSGMANARFNLAARTGGAVETHWVDNVLIHTENYVGPMSFTVQPSDIGVLTGTPAAFTARVNDPGQVSAWQWQSAPAGSVAFTNILGANSDSYSTPATTLADNGAQFRVLATGLAGPVPSDIAVLTVIDPTLPPPTAQLDFDANSTVAYGFAGVAFEDVGEGIDGSGYVSLTTAGNDQNGMLFIDDFNAGQPVNSMVASWAMRIGGGSSPPADGVSFVWGNDVGNSTAPTLFGEEGSGNGLVVSFDTYENGGLDVPGISLRWQGAQLAEKPMPFSAFLSDPDYFPTVVKVDADGTVDVWYNNEVIFYNVPLPGWNGLSNASFVWGARTGGLNENAFIDDIRLTTTIAPPPTTDTINIAVQGGNIVITYTGTLQSSLTMGTGTWQTVGGASSPYVIPMPATGQLYFRSAR